VIYLLDTNIVSETLKKKANPGVISWISTVPIHEIALSVLTLGEIRKGVEGVSDSSRKKKFIQWLEIDLVAKFKNRIIPIDEKVSDKWGYLCANSKQTLPAIDGLIAASALVYNLKVVTRNVKGFEKIPGLEIINPWD
jgi:predicted nucleic acid-binding protein